MRAEGAAVVATIVDLTHDGVGVADLEGREVFVADALPGERVEIVLRKRRRKLQEADLKRVLEPSPSRVQPAASTSAAAAAARCSISRTPAQVSFKQRSRRRDAEAHRSR